MTKRKLDVLANAAHDAHSRFDSWGKPLRATCAEKCAHCCNQLVAVGLPEVLLIIRDHFDVILERLPLLEKQARRQKEISDGITSETYDADRIISVAQKWWLEKQPCVFLNADKTCAIYASRPLACRSMYVVSDPSLCATGHGDTIINEQAEYLSRSLMAEVELENTGAYSASWLQLLVYLIVDSKMEDISQWTKRVPVQGDLGWHRSRLLPSTGGPTKTARPPGTIAWWEHLEAYDTYAKRYGTSQSPERIADRGGFGHTELLTFLGRTPRSFRSDV